MTIFAYIAAKLRALGVALHLVTPVLKPGTRVRMSEAFKTRMRGKCGRLGAHQGPFDPGDPLYNGQGGDCYGCSTKHIDESREAPEVDVRWSPNGLRYGYDSVDLVVAEDT